MRANAAALRDLEGLHDASCPGPQRRANANAHPQSHTGDRCQLDSLMALFEGLIKDLYAPDAPVPRIVLYKI